VRNESGSTTMSTQTLPVRFLRHLTWLPITASFLVCAGQSSAPAPSSPEEALFRMTNAARSEQGLSPLQWDDSLARAANAHAALVLQNRQLSHHYPGEADLTARAAGSGSHFQTISENIAEGGSADSIQKQWMNSPPHRANILDPNLNSVGFAVVQQGGVSYAVADFAKTVPSLSPDQIESAIAKLLVARGIPASGGNADARQTCGMDHGAAGSSKPLFIMRWQSSDLTRLPSELEERLQSGRYHTATVGACTNSNAGGGFTNYNVAVLLY
jgi:uncharacterized protein YkwD